VAVEADLLAQAEVHDPEKESDERQGERDRKRDDPVPDRRRHGGTLRRSHWCVREFVQLSLRRARFDSSTATKPRAETAKVASLSSLMTPTASVFGPMIPVMVTKILTVAFVSVVLIGLGVFVAYYAFELAFHFLDDD
jgi:hypothetical protein